MPTYRKKPAVGLTLDADVVAWVNSEAARKRLKPSQFVNSVLAESMNRPAADAAAVVQVHNGHGGVQKAVVRKRGRA